MKTIGKPGLTLIKDSEGLRLFAYRDGAGEWTIGYGHTRSVHEGQVITEAQAQYLLSIDLKTAEDAVNELVTIDLTQNQYDALVSFCFNVGVTNFKDSTLLKAVNHKNFKQVPVQFERWVYDNNGRIEDGLVKRRRAEAQLFSTI